MSLSGKRVLVVEDEPIIAMTLEDMLTDVGVAVVGPASTVRQAIELASREAIDAAILDLNLGGESSHGVADVLRARNVPFVFATGYGAAGYAGDSDAGVVQKPYRRDHVAAALEKAIDRSINI